MKTLFSTAWIRRLAGDQKGLAAVEYAVLGAIVVGAITAIGIPFKAALASAFEALFNTVSGS